MANPPSSLAWQDYLDLHSNRLWGSVDMNPCCFFGFVLFNFIFFFLLFDQRSYLNCLVRLSSVQKMGSDRGSIILLFPRRGILLNISQTYLVDSPPHPPQMLSAGKMVVKSSRARNKRRSWMCYTVSHEGKMRLNFFHNWKLPYYPCTHY